MASPSPWPARLLALGSGAGLLALVWAQRDASEALPPPAPPPALLQAAPASAAPATAVAEGAVEPHLALERLAARGGSAEALRAACTGVLTDDACAVLVAHPDWGVVAARSVGDGLVVLGASGAQVEAAWGAPVLKRPEGNRVAWCYDDTCASGMYLLDDRVVALME